MLVNLHCRRSNRSHSLTSFQRVKLANMAVNLPFEEMFKTFMVP